MKISRHLARLLIHPKEVKQSGRSKKKEERNFREFAKTFSQKIAAKRPTDSVAQDPLSRARQEQKRRQKRSVAPKANQREAGIS